MLGYVYYGGDFSRLLEPSLDGPGGFYTVHTLHREGRHVQLRTVSVGAADRRDPLRSSQTW